MQRRVFLGALFCALAAAQAPQTSNERPKLVLAIVVDQMRYDYLTRFGPEMNGGLRRLLDKGAVFTNANYEAAPTVTAVGHSTFLTGAPPSVSGIAGNIWFDRGESKNVASITDDTVKTLGGASAPASPRRLLVSTIGDELKVSGAGGKVVGVSLKDRSAILPAGRMADGAFWFDPGTGAFVSSTYYYTQLPSWASEFNAKKPADKYAGKIWLDLKMPETPGGPLYRALDASPFADELVLEFALRAMQAEQLGRGNKTDLLAVSFSGVDYVGHASGPDTPRMRDMVLQVDKTIGRLLDAAERQAGQGNVLVAFTADHGVAPVPEENVARKLPGGRYDPRMEWSAAEAALKAEFGEGTYIAGTSESGLGMGLYLNFDPVPGKKIDRAALERVAANALRNLPHIFRVYTRTELENGGGGDRVDIRIRNGFHRQRSGDVFVVHDPNWVPNAGRTTHGTPFSYDTHVPVILWGPANTVRPGQYHTEAAVHDIAPTLATMLRIATPSGAIGRVLHEVLP